MDNTNAVGWLVSGAVLGMAAGLLLAPASGQRTRARLGRRWRRTRDEGEHMARELGRRGEEVLEKAADLRDAAAETAAAVIQPFTKPASR
jgi:gas vesicle protein